MLDNIPNPEHLGMKNGFCQRAESRLSLHGNNKSEHTIPNLKGQ